MLDKNKKKKTGKLIVVQKCAHLYSLFKSQVFL